MNPHKEREKFAQTIGVVFGQRSQLWWDIAVQESFRLLKKYTKCQMKIITLIWNMLFKR